MSKKKGVLTLKKSVELFFFSSKQVLQFLPPYSMKLDIVMAARRSLLSSRNLWQTREKPGAALQTLSDSSSSSDVFMAPPSPNVTKYSQQS